MNSTVLHNVLIHTEYIIEVLPFYLVPYLVFFALAVAVRKTEYSKRRLYGNVMFFASLPGLVASAINILLFLVLTGWLYAFEVMKEYGEQEPVLLKELEKCIYWVPPTTEQLSAVVFVILGIIAIVCGIKLIREDLCRVVGWLCVCGGVGEIVYAAWIFLAMMSGMD